MVQRSAFCRSWRELSNACFLAQFGFDTAENEPFQDCPLSAYRSPRSRSEGSCHGVFCCEDAIPQRILHFRSGRSMFDWKFNSALWQLWDGGDQCADHFERFQMRVLPLLLASLPLRTTVQSCGVCNSIARGQYSCISLSISLLADFVSKMVVLCTWVDHC